MFHLYVSFKIEISALKLHNIPYLTWICCLGIEIGLLFHKCFDYFSKKDVKQAKDKEKPMKYLCENCNLLNGSFLKKSIDGKIFSLSNVVSYAKMFQKSALASLQ